LRLAAARVKSTSEWLGSILLIGVFGRHDLTWLPGYSPAGWFYILGGIWEMILCATLLLFLRSPLAVAALWIGILEGAQISTCRLLTTDIHQVKGNLCDALTNLPIGATMTALYVLIICWAIGKAWRNYGR
jgi:hypothetical protein